MSHRHREYLETFLEQIQSRREPAQWLLVLLRAWSCSDKFIASLVQVVRRIVHQQKVRRLAQARKNNLHALEMREKQETDNAESVLDVLS